VEASDGDEGAAAALRRLAALALLAALPATAAVQDDVPRPASLAPADVAAWSDKHLTAKDWRVLSIGEHGLFLASPKGFKLRPDGLAEAELRHELFAAMDVGGGAMRSDLETWAVDCRSRRHALMKMTLYRRNNLQDELAHRETETPKWLDHKPGDEAAGAIGAICDAVAGAKAPKPPGHP